MFGDDLKTNNDLAFSNMDGEGGEAVRIFRDMVRKNALNKFNPEYCEKVLQSYLDPKISKAKDTKNMYYKRVEKVCYRNNQNLAKYFGYKCQLNRNPENYMFTFEVYTPCLIGRTKNKI